MNKNKKTNFFSFSLHFFGLVTATGAVISTATVLGFLGRFHWFFDLFSHFRVLYFIALASISIYLLILHYYKIAGTLLILAFSNLAVILPLFFGGQPAAPKTADTMRAVQLNVNTQSGNPKLVGKFLEESTPDILILEEINDQWVTDLQWLVEFYPYSSIEEREDNFGICLLSKFPITKSEIVYIGDGSVPSIVATIDTPQGKLVVIATHPPPPIGALYSQWRNSQLNELPEYTKIPLPTILIGDLNVTPWNYHFKKLLKNSGLINSSQGRGIYPTWPNKKFILPIPIDHFLHSSSIYIANKMVGPSVGSDHRPIIVDFYIKND